MASSSALPTASQLLEYVSQLLQRNSQTEAETIHMTLQCLELKGKIEKTKASVVKERMKQLVCADEITHLKKMAAPLHSGAHSTVATPGTLVPRTRQKCVPGPAAAAGGVSPVSFRAKRKGMFFDAEISDDVVKRLTGELWFED